MRMPDPRVVTDAVVVLREETYLTRSELLPIEGAPLLLPLLIDLHM